MCLPRSLLSLVIAAGLLAPSVTGAQTTPDAQTAPASPASDSLQQADAAFHAGYAALQAGNLEQARAQFAQASRLAPQIPEAHEALADVLIQLGKPGDAIPEFEAALKLTGPRADLLDDVGSLYAQ